ncbi:glycosyltransferase family 4 protein [Candidatus Uhrbacteria bacterium]|nr:glycosyltransferase family 4 protein [Candidatus Uhrbacteria bacterium]
MKKILLITLEYPPQHGGVASYYGGLVEELKRQGHGVDVVADDGPHWHNPSHPPLTLRGGELLGWVWPRWFKTYRTVRRVLKKQKYDLLFVGHVLPLGTVAYLLRKRVPYVVFTHGMDVLMAQKSWRKRWLTKKILSHAKLIVANSEFTKRCIENARLQKFTIVSNRNRMIVVYPCPEISTDVKTEDVELLRRKLGLVGKRVILTLGRVVERKGHDLVIKALPEILQHVPEVVYVVAGDGPDLGRLQRMVAESALQTPSNSPSERGRNDSISSPARGISPPVPILENRGSSAAAGTRGGDQEGVGGRGGSGGLQPYVRFVGVVSDEERAAYFALCDLFVMPSRQIGADVEGFGIVFLEAAMFGKPSIGGRSGGIPEAILDGKTGALVDPNDPAAFARVAVQLLRDDALRYELGQNAKARVVHEFRWERQIEKLIRSISSP